MLQRKTYSLVFSDFLGFCTDSADPQDIVNLDFIIANGSNSSNPTVQTQYDTVGVENYYVVTSSQNVYTHISNTTGKINKLFTIFSFIII